MNRIACFVCLIVLSNILFAQENTLISVSFENTPAKEAIIEISGKSGIPIYFDPASLEDITISGNYQDQHVGELIKEILPYEHFHIFESQGTFIITKDVKIIEDLPLLRAFSEDSIPSTTPVEKGLIFFRDYAADIQDTEDQESKVFEIGQRSKMIKGANANLVGYVKEKDTGNPIPDVLVYVQNPTALTTTNNDGFFSISLPVGRNEVFFQYVGFKPTKRNIVVFSEGSLEVEMMVDIISLREVLVESDKDVNVSNVQMGVSRIDVEGTKNVPIVLGERDVMKVATTFAGVQTAGEGANGFNVRGGKADQNLILFNGSPVYNSSHFLGFFSVFNSDVIADMDIYKASMPARLGGRLSSVFDIQGKAASTEEFSGRGGISPITSKLALEIPIIKGKSGLLIGGRSTYSNWILKKTKNANFNENRISFSDLIVQYDHQLSDTDHLQFSTYFSSDEFRLKSDTLFSFSDISYQNRLASLKWKKNLSSKLDVSASLNHSGYGYDVVFDQSVKSAFQQDFDIVENGLTLGSSYYLNDQNTISFGTSVKDYKVNPGSQVPLSEDSEVRQSILDDTYGREWGLYLEDDIELNEKWRFSVGLRYSFFQSIGPGNVFTYLDSSPRNSSTITDTLGFNSGEVIQTYGGPEFRLASRYALSDNASIKASFNQSRQYIHTLTNSGTISPTDTWALSSYHIKPQTANQWSAGYFQNFSNDQIEMSLEAYYKKLENLIDFKVGTSFLLNNNLETVVLQGPGKSYGLEFSLKKKGQLSGWLNYTFARTLLKLDSDFSEEIINEGEFYPTSYDKPHSFNLVANYKLTRRVSFSMNVNYSSGRPVTAPVGVYEFKENSLVHFSDRNTFRIPDYFRMDLGINLEEGHSLKKLTYAYWSFSVYNVLSRDNAYSVFFDSRNGEISSYKLVVFGNAIPTLSFNFRF